MRIICLLAYEVKAIPIIAKKCAHYYLPQLF